MAVARYASPDSARIEAADVHFVIGRMNSGITTSQDKLLAGATIDGRDATAAVRDRAIREAGADFVAELVAGRNLNDHVHAWAHPREREVWREVRAAAATRPGRRVARAGRAACPRPRRPGR